MRYKFKDEEVLKAELRLHKGPADPSYDPDDEVEVRLYQLVPGSTGEENRLDTKHFKFNFQGGIK